MPSKARLLRESGSHFGSRRGVVRRGVSVASIGSEELDNFRFVEPVSQRLLLAVAENLPPGERTAVRLLPRCA